MLVFLLSFILGSEEGHIPTFWLPLYYGLVSVAMASSGHHMSGILAAAST